ncbi:hypothetical protein TSMEX_011437 [Taenia solium]|eukprot:TsM_000812600 transcript=TsM_000812600 gene=TsM_000812600
MMEIPTERHLRKSTELTISTCYTNAHSSHPSHSFSGLYLLMLIMINHV